MKTKLDNNFKVGEIVGFQPDRSSIWLAVKFLGNNKVQFAHGNQREIIPGDVIHQAPLWLLNEWESMTKGKA